MMKKYLFLILVFYLLPFYNVISQDAQPLSELDITGRWIEVKRIEGDKEKLAGEFPDTYIFRDNMVFHKGEAAEGVILFNITGKYVIKENIISIFYNNYLSEKPGTKPKMIEFTVISQQDKEMLVAVKDYNYEYKMLLKKIIY